MKKTSYNTVTTFSKILAAVLFITLPMVTLLIGMEYQKNLTVSYYKMHSIPQSVCQPTSSVQTNENFARSYVHARGKYMIQYPSYWSLYDEEHEVGEGEPVDTISSINIKNEQSIYNTFISVKVRRNTIAHYKSVYQEPGITKETKDYILHDAGGTREVIDEGNFERISYLLERKGLLYEITLNVLKEDPNKKQEFELLEKIFSKLEFNDFLPDNCKQ